MPPNLDWCWIIILSMCFPDFHSQILTRWQITIRQMRELQYYVFDNISPHSNIISNSTYFLAHATKLDGCWIIMLSTRLPSFINKFWQGGDYNTIGEGAVVLCFSPLFLHFQTQFLTLSVFCAHATKFSMDVGPWWHWCTCQVSQTYSGKGGNLAFSG